MYLKKLKIGNVQLKNNLILAPMAGVTDLPFRIIAEKFNPGLVCTEMVSSKALFYGDVKTKQLLKTDGEKRPISMQIFGSDTESMGFAAKYVSEFADIVDINMGCPAPKVANNGGGSALMKDPELAGKIVKAVVENSSVPVTVKIRAGYDNDNINAVDIAQICEQNGAQAITVHGRTRPQMYAPPVNLDVIRDVKKAVNVPVIGNGDVRSAVDAAKMYEYTNCDLVMVGRAACGAPWIFQQIDAYLNETKLLPEPPISERMLLLLRQVKNMIEYKDEHTAMRQARKHAAYYMKGIKGAAAYRRDCGTLNTYSDLERLCFKVFTEHKDDEI